MTGTSNSASFSSPFLKVFDNRSCDIRKKIDIWITNKNILKQNTDHSSNLPKTGNGNSYAPSFGDQK